MLITESLKEKLKAEIELFKVYSFFVAGLAAGNSSIILQDMQTARSFIMLFIGVVFLIVSMILLVSSFFKIRNYIKLLNN
jgi:hypothetical protein